MLVVWRETTIFHLFEWLCYISFVKIEFMQKIASEGFFKVNTVVTFAVVLPPQHTIHAETKLGKKTDLLRNRY